MCSQDPDSNDERFHGNDYPEELEGDNDSDEEGRCFLDMLLSLQ